MVAQSFGGFTAPLVADQVPARALVLVTGMLPAPGESPDDWVANTGFDRVMREQTQQDVFYHDVPCDLADQARSKARVQSATPGHSPWPLSAWPDVPTKFILCTEDRFFPPGFMRRVIAERLGITPDEIASGHCAALSHPKKLAGVYYHLYVMTGIFSRCAVHFEVHATELGELAKDFMTEAVRLNGGTAPQAIHADRGTSVTSKPVSALLSDLAILKSHSRPKVSNDNPYSEAQFKTLKYCPAFPGTFGSLQDARAFCGVFFTYYNHEHRHSGIGLHTPYSVHIGTAHAIQEQRQAVLNAACAANPRRFTRRPRAPRMPVTAWINKPVTASDVTQHPSQEVAREQQKPVSHLT